MTLVDIFLCWMAFIGPVGFIRWSQHDEWWKAFTSGLLSGWTLFACVFAIWSQMP
jgi:hypothetical protein